MRMAARRRGSSCPCAPMPAEVEGVMGRSMSAARLHVVVHDQRHRGDDLEVIEACGASRRGRSPRPARRGRSPAWSGEKNRASQPSHSSAASATFFGPSAPRKIGMSSRTRVDGGLQRLAEARAVRVAGAGSARRRASPGPCAPRCRAGSPRTPACGPAAWRTAARTSPRRPADPTRRGPSTKRPPERWSMVMAAIAVAAGWRARHLHDRGAQPHALGARRPTRPAG